ncbi:MAG: calcium-binding protein [Aestuariivirga sp.]
MTTTPTLWGSEVTFSFDTFAFGPEVSPLADGTFTVVWQDGTDIFGRHLNEFGSFTGGNFLSALSAARTKDIFGPQLVQTADGQTHVFFNELFGPGDGDIRWHAPTADFTPHGLSFGVEETGFDEFLWDSTARSDGVGGFGSAIVFATPRPGPGPETLLVLRFVAPNGLPASNQIFVGERAGETQQNAAIAGRHTGHVVVAYENFNFATSQRDIRLHAYAPDETDTSGEVQVSATNVNAGFPDVAALKGGSTGNFVVVWQQNDGIAFRRYFAEATPLDASPRVIPGSLGFVPKITALNDGGFIIAWGAIDGTEGDGSPELDIFLQRFNGAGDAVGGVVHMDKPGDQGLDFSIATLSDGRVILTYQSETGDATNVTTLNYQFFDPREATIFGTLGKDNIVGREDGSNISGFDGDDKLAGRGAIDTILGGTGNDQIAGGGAGDILDGGIGTLDALDYSSSGAGVVINLALNTASGGDATGDQITNFESVIGSFFNDTLTGGAGTQRFEGRSGNDRLTGGADRDALFGGFGNDVVDGGSGNDSISGDDGNDVIIDGTGSDIARGGAGDDTFLASADAASDTFLGDAGTDTISLAAATSATVVTFGAVPFAGTVTGGGLGTITFGGIERIIGGNFIDTINGGAAPEVFFGRNGNDIVNGGGSNDRIFGEIGADILNGGTGLDTISGGDGNDEIAGGAQADTLIGDAGADDFNYAALSESGAAGRDRIIGFVHLIDDIDVSAIDAMATTGGNNAFTQFIGAGAFTAEGQIRAFQAGTSTIIEFNTAGANGAEMSIQLLNFTAATLTLADFIA